LPNAHRSFEDCERRLGEMKATVIDLAAFRRSLLTNEKNRTMKQKTIESSAPLQSSTARIMSSSFGNEDTEKTKHLRLFRD
jgi:hypothetical protein